jgi:hypothetical protein
MSDDPDAELFNAVIESRLARMSDTDWHALTKRVRPPADPAPAAIDESNLPITRRSGFAQKCGQLADLAAAAGGQGYQHGITDRPTPTAASNRRNCRSRNPLRSKAQRRSRSTGVRANRVAAHRCPNPRKAATIA